MFIICNELTAVLKDFDIHWHYKTKHGAQFDAFEDNVRKHKFDMLKRRLCLQQNFLGNVFMKVKPLQK